MGLDVLIEALVRDIAYTGDRGQTVKEFIDAVNRLSADPKGTKQRGIPEGDGQVEASSSAALSEDEDDEVDTIQPARCIWEWVVARPEVSVGINREWNSSTIDDVLKLDENPNPAPVKPATSKSVRKSRNKRRKISMKKEVECGVDDDDDEAASASPDTIWRPRITVTEECQWKALTGHEPNYKKIPPLEWNLLVGIATGRQNGILQAEVRDMTGQDKRSVPKRTDFLAMKGYITKRTVTAKGAKTSKLWLQGFAPAELSGDVHSSLSNHDLFADAQKRNYDPVPWCWRWSGHTIESEVFGRTIVAILKAFSVMRTVDLKRKMGVLGNSWQMRSMSALVRRFVALGVLKYVAGSMPHDRRVFNDCVKFVREPTVAEWKDYLMFARQPGGLPTKSHDKQPTKKKQSDKEKKAAEQQFAPKKEQNDDGADEDEDAPADSKIGPWDLHKPLSSRAFDIIQRAGSKGIMNPTISEELVGQAFTRYMFSYLQHAAVPGRQPKHLQHFQLDKEIQWTGKTKAYWYTARQDRPDPKNADYDYGFGPGPARLKTAEPKTLVQLSKTCKRPPEARGRQRFHKHTSETAASQSPEAQLKSKTRTPKPVQPSNEDQASNEDQTDVVMVEAPQPPPVPQRAPTPTPPPAPKVYRAPGAYRGEPNSLEPAPPSGAKKRGRPKKSIVLILVSEKLKDPNFLKSSGNQARDDSAQEEVPDEEDQVPQQPVIQLGDAIPDSDDEGPSTFTAARFTAVNQASPASTAVKSEDADEEVADASQEIVHCDPVDGLLFKGARGKLRLIAESRTIQFEYDGNPPTEPLVMSVDKITNKPGIRKVARSENGQYFLFELKENAKSPSRRYMFNFEDESQDHSKDAKDFTTALAQLRKEFSDANDTKKGRPKLGKAKAKTKGGKPAKKVNENGYECETCGGVWKNDIGLKYHQTKAKNSCNPNWNPDADQPKRGPRPGAEYVQSSPRRTTRFGNMDSSLPLRRIRVPVAPSSGPPSWLKRKAITYENLRQSEGEPRRVVDGQTAPQIGPHKPSLFLVDNADQNGATLGSNTEAKKDNAAATGADPSLEEVDVVVLLEDGTLKQTTTMVPRVPKKRKALPTGRPDEPKRRKVSFALDDSGSPLLADSAKQPSLPSKTSESPSTQDPAQTNANETVDTSRLRIDESESLGLSTTSTNEPDGTRVALRQPVVDFKEFVMPTDQDTRYFNDPQLRRYRTQAIINYLLDSCRGVYPAEKAMYYSVVGIYRKHFPNDDPPRSRNVLLCKNGLIHSNVCKEHNYAFKGNNRRFINCRLIVRSGIAPNGPTAVAMRNRVIASYPNVYIPPPFVPSKETQVVLAQFQTKAPPSVKNHRFGPRHDLDEVVTLDSIFTEPSTTAQRAFKKQQKALDLLEMDGDRVGGRKRRRSEDSDDSLLGRASKRKLSTWQDNAKQRMTGRTEDDFPPIDPYPRSHNRIMRQNPGLDSLPEWFFNNAPVVHQSAALEFVHFGERDPMEVDDDNTSVISSLSTPQSPSSTRKASTVPEPEPKDIFVKPFTLNGSGENWPDLPQSFFEKHDNSFIMNGKLPTQAELLLDYFPKDFMEIHRAQRGPSYNAAKSRATPLAAFTEDVKYVEKWEQSAKAEKIMYSSGIMPHYRFINMEFPGEHKCVPIPELRWKRFEQKSVHTLPYDDLEAGSDVDEKREYKALTARGRGRGRGTVGRPRGRGRGGRGNALFGTIGGQYITEGKLDAYKRLREYTSFPQTPEEYFELPSENHYGLNWRSDDVLTSAFVAVRTLIGGIGKTIDWGLMMRLFPHIKISALRKYWKETNKTKTRLIRNLTEKFQARFPLAYEEGQLPPIDFDNILAYDWHGLIVWTVGLANEAAFLALPPKRELLRNKLRYVENRVEQQDWRTEFFTPNMSVHNRLKVICSEAATWAPKRESSTLDNESVARSWVRSLACTPLDRYPPQDIKDKILTLGGLPEEEIENVLNTTITRLQLHKLIRARKAGAFNLSRPYEMSDPYYRNLDKFAYRQKFQEAAEFKTMLDAHFRHLFSTATAKDKICLTVPYNANEGSMLALMQMQARGRVRLEGINLPNHPFGFQPGNYNTRLWPRGYHHFDFKVLPTDRYVYNEDIAPLARAAESTVEGIPGEGTHRELPIWCDFFGRKDEARWIKTLSAVVHAVAVRGMGSEGMHTGALIHRVAEPFEFKLVVEWCKGVGVASGAVAGGGDVMGEWWWMVVAKLWERVEEEPEPVPVPEVVAEVQLGLETVEEQPGEAGVVQEVVDEEAMAETVPMEIDT